MADTLQITQVKSTNGAEPEAARTLRTLGLGKIGRTTERAGRPDASAALVDTVQPPGRRSSDG